MFFEVCKLKVNYSLVADETYDADNRILSKCFFQKQNEAQSTFAAYIQNYWGHTELEMRRLSVVVRRSRRNRPQNPLDARRAGQDDKSPSLVCQLPRQKNDERKRTALHGSTRLHDLPILLDQIFQVLSTFLRENPVLVMGGQTILSTKNLKERSIKISLKLFSTSIVLIAFSNTTSTDVFPKKALQTQQGICCEARPLRQSQRVDRRTSCPVQGIQGPKGQEASPRTLPKR
jgi:hypothetical protein